MRHDHTLEFPAIIDTKAHMEPPGPGEKFVLMVFVLVLSLAFMAWCGTNPNQAQGAPAWTTSQVSYYYPTGNRTACGKPMTTASWHVASLGGSTAECGDRLWVCHKRRCVRVTVEDTGPGYGWRRWDATPRVKAALRCGDLCIVRWKYDR